jgi:glycosyltransferase involved in cell wall biosynthesis
LDNPVQQSAVRRRPLKVLQVLSGRVRSGIESQVLNISRGLRAQGVEIVLAPLTWGSFADEARAEGFDVRSPRKRFVGDPRTFWRLARLARDERVDVIHTHGEAASFYGRIAALLAGGRPVVTTVHSFTPKILQDFCKSRVLRWLILKQDKWLARWTHRLILVTPELDPALREAGFPPEKLVTISNIVDLDKCTLDAAHAAPVRQQFGLPADALVFGFVGRLAPVKDPLLFVEFAQRLTAEYPLAYFLVIGDGRMRSEVEEAVQARSLRSRVHFVGWQTDVRPWLASLDVLVVTSKTETVGTTACEAMVLGKPVISNNVGGMGDVVRPGETGFLANNLDELVEAGAACLRDRTLVATLGEGARRFIVKFVSEQDAIGKLVSVYESAIAAG